MATWQLRARVHEQVFNTVFDAIAAQRPSLLNYATAALAKRGTTCQPVPPPSNGSPAYTTIPPLVLGQDNRARLLADYCYQLAGLQLDFSPLANGGPENFRLTANIQVGLGLPDQLALDDLLLPTEQSGPSTDNFIDYPSLQCFTSNLEAAGVARFIQYQGRFMLLFQLTQFSLGGAPGNLLALVETYIRTMVNAVILPKAAFVLTPLPFSSPDGQLPDISVVLTPATLPNNPEFAGNQVALYLALN